MIAMRTVGVVKFDNSCVQSGGKAWKLFPSITQRETLAPLFSKPEIRSLTKCKIVAATHLVINRSNVAIMFLTIDARKAHSFSCFKVASSINSNSWLASRHFLPRLECKEELATRSTVSSEKLDSSQLKFLSVFNVISRLDWSKINV